MTAQKARRKAPAPIKAAFDAAAFDAFRNIAARMGTGSPSVPEAADYELVRWSLNYWLMITLYRNHWIVRRIVDGRADDMTAAWPKMMCQVKPQLIDKIERMIDRTQTKPRVNQAIKWARLFGGSGALMVIDGHEDYLDEPLDLDEVNPGAYKGLIVFDRWCGITPGPEINLDVNDPIHYGLPMFYDVHAKRGGTFRVHASRILRFCGPDIPSPEKEAMSHWGISALEPVYEDLRKRDNASWAILNLLFRANILAMQNPDLAQAISGASMSEQALMQYEATQQRVNQMLNNNSMLALGEDQQLQQIQYSFAGVNDVYGQFQMDIAGAAESTVTRLFGRTITGLGQTNDADERLYEQSIARDQSGDMKTQIVKLYAVICMSELGQIPDDLDLKFPSIRVLNETEKAEMADKGTKPFIDAFNAGLISQKLALMELRAMSDQTGIFTNITNDDIAAADEQPVQPMGDMPGAKDDGKDN